MPKRLHCAWLVDIGGVFLQPDQERRAFALAGGAGALAAGGMFGGCSTPRKVDVAVQDSGPDAPPPAPREFRAARVATVANIDWPSKPNLKPARARPSEAKGQGAADRGSGVDRSGPGQPGHVEGGRR
jgi:hypothetical protein